MEGAATFRWGYLDAHAQRVGASEAFASRTDAEEWLGDRWPDLLADGVLEVELTDGDAVVYRMGLTAVEPQPGS